MSYISDYKAGAMSDEEYKYNSNRDRDETIECCGTCKHCHYVKKDTFCCDNEESYYYGDYTEYSDGCEQYECKHTPLQ